MFNCSLCRDQCQEYVYVSSHCSECCEIRRIISLYNRKDVLDTLRLVYLRDEQEKRTNRTIKKVEDEDKKEIVTRSKSKEKS
jgi:hypothetical protein